MENMFSPNNKKIEPKKSFKKMNTQQSIQFSQVPHKLKEGSFTTPVGTLDSKQSTPRSQTYKISPFPFVSNKNPQICQSFKKSSSKTKLNSKNRMTPPLQRTLKSQKKLPTLSTNCKPKLHEHYCKKQTEKEFEALYNNSELNPTIQKLKKMHEEEISALKQIITDIIGRGDHVKKPVDQLNKQIIVNIKHQDITDINMLRRQIEFFKALFLQGLQENNNNIKLLKETEQNFKREKELLQKQIQVLKQHIVTNKVKIDHLFTHASYDKKKNTVENKISQIDQKYEISQVKGQDAKNMNGQYYNKKSPPETTIFIHKNGFKKSKSKLIETQKLRPDIKRNSRSKSFKKDGDKQQAKTDVVIMDEIGSLDLESVSSNLKSQI